METAKKKKRAGKRCIAALCSDTYQDGVSLHYFPKNEALAKRWSSQVKKSRADWTKHSKHSVICSKDTSTLNIRKCIVKLFILCRAKKQSTQTELCQTATKITQTRKLKIKPLATREKGPKQRYEFYYNNWVGCKC